MPWKPTRLTKAQLEERRKAAIELLNNQEDKKTQKEVAEIMGVSRIALYYWQRRATAGTLDSVKQSGRPSRMSKKQLQELLELLKESPDKYGYPTIGWTTKVVADFIKRKFAIEYAPDHVGVILRQAGMSVQVPKIRGVRRDEAKIKTWTQETFPTLKKNTQV
jgi:putative transposase